MKEIRSGGMRGQLTDREQNIRKTNKGKMTNEERSKRSNNNGRQRRKQQKASKMQMQRGKERHRRTMSDGILHFVSYTHVARMPIVVYSYRG